jgi:ferredoxin-NADP reductase/MOSC domain-containing protein YiiM/ferredoxin
MRSVPTLLSVNVGTPRTVAWQGRQVRTAIFKDPVAGPRFVGRINIEGDDQADRLAHGGEHRAVFVYQIESYRHWEGQLGRNDFTYGQFGENFTVEGLADDEVCIGDRYRIGGALFEVTQPRVTCYRVGIRMDEPLMPALLVSHRRPGFYMRVLEEGVVAAGQEIVKVTAGPEAMTVADIDALLYLPGRRRRNLIRALKIPALSEGWKGSFRELLDRETASGSDDRDAPKSPLPAWPGFRSLRVDSIVAETAAVISITLSPTGSDTAPAATPGQFLTLRLRPDAGQAPVTRNYSLSGLPVPGSYRISVKREPHGAASGYLHTALAVGDVIEVAAPRGSFTLQSGERPVVLISAGVGATPVLAMLHALAAERSEREVWWIHGARNRARHSFRHEAAGLVDGLPRGHRLIAYSAPDPEDRAGADFDVTGHLTGAVLADAGVPTDADFYVCGPGAFMHDLAATLTANGVAPDRVRSEVFGPSDVYRSGIVGLQKRAPHAPDGAPRTGLLVLFSRSNLSVRWDPSFGNMLDLADACDVPVGFGCRTGVCHQCESGLVSGEVDYAPEPLEPPEAGRVLMCCSQPRGDVALDL